MLLPALAVTPSPREVVRALASRPWRVEPKVDGVRVLVYREGGVWVPRTRTQKVVALPDNVIQALDRLFPDPPDGVVIDGEVWAESLRQTVSALQTGKPLAYVVFDLVWGGGNHPFEDRRAALEERFSRLSREDLGPVGLILQTEVSTVGEVVAYFQQSLKEGFEGVMLKDPRAPYSGRRDASWLKLKPTYADEFEIVGFEEGSAPGTVGAFHLRTVSPLHQTHPVSVRVEAGEPVGKVGGGMTFDEREDFWARRESLLGKRVSVKYSGLTRTEGTKLREPVFISLRDYE